MRDDKWGLVSADRGTLVLEPAFDQLVPWSQNQILVRKDGKVGVYTADGEVVVEASYDRIARIDAGFKVERDGKQGIVDADGTLRIDPAYDLVEPRKDGFHVELDGRTGKLAADGRVLLSPKFDQVRESFRLYVDGTKGPVEFFVVGEAGRWGLYNEATGFVVPPEYSAITAGENVFVNVRGPEGWGVYRTTGELWVPPRYDRATLRDGGYHDVQKGGQHGIVADGQEVLAPRYLRTAGWSADHRVAAVQSEEGWGLVRPDGSWALGPGQQPLLLTGSGLYVLRTPKEDDGIRPPREAIVSGPRPLADVFTEGDPSLLYERLDREVDGLGVVSWKGKVGLMADDRVVVPPDWDDIARAWHGRALVKRGDGVGLVDTETGRVALSPDWERIGRGFDGWVPVRGERGWGVLHEATGEFLFEPTHRDIESKKAAGRSWWFVEGREGQALYTADGVRVTEPYGYVRVLGNGLVPVRTHDRHHGLLRLPAEGEVVEVLLEADLDDLDQGPGWLATRGEEVAFLDDDGTSIVAFGEYDQIEPMSLEETYLLVRGDGRTGVLDRRGEPVIPVEWAELRLASWTRGKNDHHAWISVDDQGRQGVLWPNGLELLPPRCDAVTVDPGDFGHFGLCERRGKTFVLQRDGKLKRAP
ncbi:MAG: WG repeat-containing protein [Deltaproteobacteria bacterium]|nr:MAG: WG repeat-containing protein [Deltaproteobacteria bacterium]